MRQSIGDELFARERIASEAIARVTPARGMRSTWGSPFDHEASPLTKHGATLRGAVFAMRNPQACEAVSMTKEDPGQHGLVRGGFGSEEFLRRSACRLDDVSSTAKFVSGAMQ